MGLNDIESDRFDWDKVWLGDKKKKLTLGADEDDTLNLNTLVLQEGSQ